MLIIIAGSVPLSAQTQTWKMDPDHSNIGFSIRHMVISKVVGKFMEYDATLIISNADYSDAKLEVTIYTKSVDTGQDGRDKSLIGSDFLNVEKFPTMKFKSNSVDIIDEKNFNITGDLTLLEVTKTIVLKVSYGGSIMDPMGNTRSGWRVRTTINRFDFGMKRRKFIDAGGLVVGEEIDILIDAEFILQK